MAPIMNAAVDETKSERDETPNGMHTSIPTTKSTAPNCGDLPMAEIIDLISDDDDDKGGSGGTENASVSVPRNKNNIKNAALPARPASASHQLAPIGTLPTVAAPSPSSLGAQAYHAQIQGQLQLVKNNAEIERLQSNQRNNDNAVVANLQTHSAAQAAKVRALEAQHYILCNQCSDLAGKLGRCEQEKQCLQQLLQKKDQDIADLERIGAVGGADERPVKHQAEIGRLKAEEERLEAQVKQLSQTSDVAAENVRLWEENARLDGDAKVRGSKVTGLEEANRKLEDRVRELVEASRTKHGWTRSEIESFRKIQEQEARDKQPHRIKMAELEERERKADEEFAKTGLADSCTPQ